MADSEIKSIPRAKHAIFDTMLTLLAAKDFDEITVDEICQSADLSRSTFYRYFDDKYDLVLQCIDYYIIQPTTLFTPETLTEYFDRLLTMECSLKHSMKQIMKYGGNRELQWRIYQMLFKRLTNYYKAVVPRKDWDMVYEMIAISLCTGLTGLINWWAENDFPVPQKTMVAYIVYLIEAPILFSS